MYYVYVYLNPLKPGTFSYGEITFEFEPFYIGKGKNNRSHVHLQKAKSGKTDINRHKNNTIKKILAHGLEPVIIKLFTSVDESQTLLEESRVISMIGRTDINTGPLTNLTNGGESPELSESTIQKMSDAKIGRKLSEETKFRISESGLGERNHFYGKKHSVESRELMSKNRVGKLKGQEHPMFGKTHSDEAKAKISESKKGRTGLKSHRSRSYKLCGPNGEIHIIHGAFDKTCKLLGIKNAKWLREVAQGKRDECNGWICEYIN